MREFSHSRINRLSQRDESRTKMASAPGNKDCEIVFVALVSSGGFAQKVSITVFSVFMNSEQKYTTEDTEVAQRNSRFRTLCARPAQD